jgi:hypothetical protein
MSPRSLRLPLDIDPEPLAAEVAGLSDPAWVPHFNHRIYHGDWSGVALRSLGGDPGRIYPDPAGGDNWLDTPLLDGCPATRAVLDRLSCRLESARFLRLGPGARIEPHNDPGLGYDHGECRLHFPVLSDDAVSFWVEDEPVAMRPGECWLLDLNRRHSAANDSAVPRVHLVVDVQRNDWLDALVSRA